MDFNAELITNSFEAIKPHANEVVSHFYKTLFKNHPEAKPLFKGVDMKKQKKALVGSLAYCVENLNDLDKVVSYLTELGKRHVQYGTEPEHYGWVGEALIQTLKYFFDDNWTEDAEKNWTALYGVMADTMIAGAKQMQESGEEAPPVEKPPEKKEPTLTDIARNHAKELFHKILEEEIEGSLSDVTRERVRELLKRTLEKEAKLELAAIRRKSA